MIRIAPRIAILLAMFVAAPALAQIVGDHDVGPAVFGAAPSSARELAVASDGVDYLVIWIDDGRGIVGGLNLYAARVLADGTVVDRGGILITSVTTIAQGLNVVWAGDAYAIFWKDSLNYSPVIWAARVSRDGVVVDLPRTLGQGFVQQRQVASNGERILVAWEGRGLTFVDSHLNVIDGPSPSIAFVSAIASNGSDFMVAYADAANVYAGRVTPAGQFDPPQLLGPRSGSAPVGIASDGRDYMVAYFRSPSLVALRHVSASGTPTDELSAVSVSSQQVGIGWGGGTYLLYTYAGTAWRIDPGGALIPGPPVTLLSTVGTTGLGPMLASSRGEALLIWSNIGSHFDPPLMAERIGNGYPVGDPIIAAQSANEQRDPSIAFSGHSYAVAWLEHDSIYLSHLSLDGRPFDGRGVRLDAGIFGSRPQVVFDGRSFVVAWVAWRGDSRPSRLLIQRVPTDTDPSKPLDPPLVAAESSCLGSVSLSVGRDATLLVWSDCSHVVSAALPQTGSTGVPLTLGSGAIGNTSAAWNGSEWLVVWEDLYVYSLNHPPLSGANLVGARLTAAMTPLDPKPIAIATGAVQPGFQLSSYSQNAPFVASHGPDFLVVWTRLDFQAPFWSPQARLRFVTGDGAPLGETEGTRVDDGSPSAAVWDGTSYAILYSRTVSSQQYGLFLARASRLGDVTAAGIMLAPSAATGESALAFTGSGSALALIYTRTATDPSYGGVGRAYVRSLGTPRVRAARSPAP